MTNKHYEILFTTVFLICATTLTAYAALFHTRNYVNATAFYFDKHLMFQSKYYHIPSRIYLIPYLNETGTFNTPSERGNFVEIPQEKLEWNKSLEVFVVRDIDGYICEINPCDEQKITMVEVYFQIGQEKDMDVIYKENSDGR